MPSELHFMVFLFPGYSCALKPLAILPLKGYIPLNPQLTRSNEADRSQPLSELRLPSLRFPGAILKRGQGDLRAKSCVRFFLGFCNNQYSVISKFFFLGIGVEKISCRRNRLDLSTCNWTSKPLQRLSL